VTRASQASNRMNGPFPTTGNNSSLRKMGQLRVHPQEGKQGHEQFTSRCRHVTAPALVQTALLSKRVHAVQQVTEMAAAGRRNCSDTSSR